MNKKILAFLACLAVAQSAAAQDLKLTGVVDGPLSGGVPKAIEIYVINNIADLSNCGVGGANNGGGTDGQEFTFPAVAATAGNYLYVASEAAGFDSFFGFAPDYTSSAASINGDDAIELFCGGSVIDVFGDINTDGTGQPWEYLDGWAYRVDSTGPDGSTFVLANWTFSGPNALDGETSNATAATPFPIATPPDDPGGPEFGVCGDDATKIHVIQGNGAASPIVGDTGVVIEGIVVASFQGSTGLNGFFVQEEDVDADTDPATSEGIFVFDGNFGTAVAVGDQVRVQGDVTEFFGLTEINNVSNLEICGTGAVPAATSVNLPVASLDDFESVEGMLVNFPQTLYVSGNFTLARFGEVELAVGGAQDNPTNVTTPGAAANALQDLNNRSRIQLEDGSTVQNPLPPPPYFGAGNTLRTGDSVGGVTGVIGYSFGRYELHPVGTVNFTRNNFRSIDPPNVGGSVKVASFNVLNYFTTIDTGDRICGPAADQRCRGADTADEFTRQRDKLVTAISKLDADVVGLIELENHPGDDPTADLVSGLNDAAGAGTYAYIATGAIGIDVIRVGLIYKPAAVTPAGAAAILDSSVDATFNDDKNRPVLAQSFSSGGTVFTVAVNHLKSKGQDCSDVVPPDLDVGDGQGNCNRVRTEAATALVNWLGTDPTGSGTGYAIIVGDLNAYAMEDPITAIKAGGYADLISTFIGSDFASGAYSFNFGAQSGYLDHALSSPDLTPFVTGTTIWHINADEPAGLDYNNFNQAGLYNPDEYRSSDHDPVLIGLFGDGDEDGVLDQSDFCPGSRIPEAVPTSGKLKPNRWALTDGDFNFDTKAPGRNDDDSDSDSDSDRRRPRSYTTADTAGCSCEQIIDAQGLGKGHRKYGCSTGVMDRWIRLVTP